MNIKDIPIFCINLKEATTRWNRIKKRFDYFNLDVRRWEASTIKEINNYNYVNWIMPHHIARAISISHFKIWKYQVDNNIPIIFILEDDAVFRKDWIDIVNNKLNIIDAEDPNWNMLLLNAFEITHPKESWSSARNQYLAGGYILTLSGAKWLVNTYGGALDSADLMTMNLQNLNHSYTYFPWLIIQEQLDSFRQPDGSQINDWNKLKKSLDEANYSIDNYYF